MISKNSARGHLAVDSRPMVRHTIRTAGAGGRKKLFTTYWGNGKILEDARARSSPQGHAPKNLLPPTRPHLPKPPASPVLALST
jgi:hypothetical protein